jgi:hypothetical protein
LDKVFEHYIAVQKFKLLKKKGGIQLRTPPLVVHQAFKKEAWLASI